MAQFNYLVQEQLFAKTLTKGRQMTGSISFLKFGHRQR